MPTSTCCSIIKARFARAGLDTVGRVDLKDYQQANTGELIVELTGTGLNQFDRLVINGAALLDGSVDVDLEGGFVPVLGNTFNIISTIAGVSGMFVNIVQDPGMPVGLFMNVKYLPTIAQLVVVDTLPGDYNRNSVVDAADYVLWRDTLGNVVAAFSGADGNGSGTIDPGDYSLWRGKFRALRRSRRGRRCECRRARAGNTRSASHGNARDVFSLSGRSFVASRAGRVARHETPHHDHAYVCRSLVGSTGSAPSHRSSNGRS